MTFDEFDKYQNDLIDKLSKIGSAKGKEYANSESRFANFDRLSQRLNIKPTAVALVYLTKHMDAIESYISRGRTYSTETIQGRIMDAIMYLMLIGGMIQEGEHIGPSRKEPPLKGEWRCIHCKQMEIELSNTCDNHHTHELTWIQAGTSRTTTIKKD